MAWSALVGPGQHPANSIGNWSGRPWSLLFGYGRRLCLDMVLRHHQIPLLLHIAPGFFL